MKRKLVDLGVADTPAPRGMSRAAAQSPKHSSRAVAPVAPAAPELPVELWIEILDLALDFAPALREVCRLFRDIVGRLLDRPGPAVRSQPGGARRCAPVTLASLAHTGHAGLIRWVHERVNVVKAGMFDPQYSPLVAGARLLAPAQWSRRLAFNLCKYAADGGHADVLDLLRAILDSESGRVMFAEATSVGFIRGGHVDKFPPSEELGGVAAPTIVVSARILVELAKAPRGLGRFPDATVEHFSAFAVVLTAMFARQRMLPADELGRALVAAASAGNRSFIHHWVNHFDFPAGHRLSDEYLEVLMRGVFAAITQCELETALYVLNACQGAAMARGAPARLDPLHRNCGSILMMAAATTFPDFLAQLTGHPFMRQFPLQSMLPAVIEAVELHEYVMLDASDKAANIAFLRGLV